MFNYNAMPWLPSHKNVLLKWMQDSCQINFCVPNQFLQLGSDIHFEVYSAPNPTNKLWSVQSIINAVRKQCNDITYYSIDEQMILFTEIWPVHQVIRSKTPPVGLKYLECAISRDVKYLKEQEHLNIVVLEMDLK